MGTGWFLIHRGALLELYWFCGGSLIGSKWGAKSLPLSEGRERSWGVRRSPVCFKDVDDLSGFGGADGPTFNFIVVTQFWVEFQQIFGHTGVQAVKEDVDCFLVT